MEWLKRCIALTTLGLFLLSFQINAQRPEKVYSFVKQIKSFDFYRSSAQSWKKELDKNKADAEAVLNFYIANRMAMMTDAETWGKEKGSYFLGLDSIVKYAEANIKDTFEYYYLLIRTYRNYDDEFEKRMLKAYELGSDRPEIFSELLGFYATRMDNTKMKKFGTMWYNSGDVSPGILNWNYNVLASLEQNAILFTNGDNDTYPAWILQCVKNFRQDVTVININLAMIETYRAKLFSGISLPPYEIDTAKVNKEKNPYFAVIKFIVQHVIKYAGNRPVYIAMTVSPALYEDIKKDLYMTGMAFKYSKEPVDNMAYLVNNYEHQWLLDHLTMPMAPDMSVSVVQQMNVNYLPVFAKLFDYYTITGNDTRKKEISTLSLKLAEESNCMEYYEQLFHCDVKK